MQNRRPRLVRVNQRSQPSLLALGDLLLDVVVVPDRPVERGTDVPGGVALRGGGSAANVCRSFARLGGRASLVCAIGSDDLGRRLVASLRRDGVTVHAARVAGATGRLAAIVEPDGERSFVTQRASADLLRAGDLGEAWFRGVGAVHVPAYSLFTEPLGGAAVRAAGLAHEAGAVLSVDLSSAGPLRELGAAVARERIITLGPDLLFASRAEAAVMLGTRASSRLPRLLDLAPLVVVKEGPEGSRVLWRDGTGTRRLDIATAPVTTDDTTGAGDAYAAGFLFVLLGGQRPWNASTLRRAALAGHRSAAALLRSARRPELAL